MQKDQPLDTVDARRSSEGIANRMATGTALCEPVQALVGLIPPWIPPLNARVRMLFHHCETTLHSSS